MIRKSTWIVVAIFVVLLAGAFYLRENPLPSAASTTTSPTAMPVLLSGWSDNDIVSLEYKGEQGLVTLVKNPDGSWLLGPDNKAPASIGQVAYLQAQLVAMRVDSVLNTTDPLDAVGLASPSRMITLRNDQGQQVEIRVGKLSVTGSGYYVQLDNQAPVVVNKYTLEAVLDGFNRDQLAAPTATPEVASTQEVDESLGGTETPQR
jgi:hypothetical protein